MRVGERDEGMISVQEHRRPKSQPSGSIRSPDPGGSPGLGTCPPARPPGLVNNRAPHVGSDQLLQTRGTAFHTGLIFVLMARVGVSGRLPCPLSIRSRGEGTGLNAQSGRFLSLLWRETHPTAAILPFRLVRRQTSPESFLPSQEAIRLVDGSAKSVTPHRGPHFDDPD